MIQQPAAVYRQLLDTYTAQYTRVHRRYSQLSTARLLTVLAALACGYLYTRDAHPLPAIAALSMIPLFILLMRFHRKAGHARQRLQALRQINEEELAYLEERKLSFEPGDAYRSELHAYAADLDLFGQRSLYHHLNRTATQMGQDALAQSLLGALPADAIPEQQEAIAEWSNQPGERQELYALARMANDNRDTYNRLLQWSAQEEPPVALPVRVLAWLLPALLGAALIAYAFTRNELFWDISTKIFPANLLLFFFMAKRVKTALFSTEKARDMLLAYALLLERIEKGSYQSAWLRRRQQLLLDQGAARQIRKLASVYSGMESVQNPFAAIFMNGLYLAHVHMLHQLSRWKAAHAGQVPAWLQVIGDMELLHSLANLRFNNPGYCFPALNTGKRIAFRALGHPLIPAAQRVCNDISFTEQRFVILTGSNMSGKSTFLRSLGVNMVLAGAGSVVCAEEADLQPMPVFVSMRQSDSLADSESYFFAEVKRLQYIMAQAAAQTSFVLLDEILRGTNSDDKRSGTIGVIRKLIERDTIGAIATHDLEVCHTTEQYPDTLSNKCFEVEIVRDELVFDYTLREGICRNKSATFLMKKMGIIQGDT